MSVEIKGLILFRGDKTYFKRDFTSSSEVGRLKVTKEDIIEYLKNSNSLSKTKVTKSGMWIYDESLYKRLIVYAASLSTMRRKNSLRILKLLESVNKLDEYSLHFWYSELVSRFKSGGLRPLGRISRSLRILYGVDR